MRELGIPGDGIPSERRAEAFAHVERGTSLARPEPISRLLGVMKSNAGPGGTADNQIG